MSWLRATSFRVSASKSVTPVSQPVVATIRPSGRTAPAFARWPCDADQSRRTVEHGGEVVPGVGGVIEPGPRHREQEREIRGGTPQRLCPEPSRVGHQRLLVGPVGGGLGQGPRDDRHGQQDRDGGQPGRSRWLERRSRRTCSSVARCSVSARAAEASRKSRSAGVRSGCSGCATATPAPGGPRDTARWAADRARPSCRGHRRWRMIRSPSTSSSSHDRSRGQAGRGPRGRSRRCRRRC